jgi:TolB protein
MDLDGGNQVALTKPGEGFCYGVSLSPDRNKVVFHVTGGGTSPFNPGHYSINVIDLTTRERSLVSGSAGHLYFGPQWSPEGKWLAFLDCHADVDPNHFSADLCITRPDGSEHRVVTNGRRHWFGTGFGSNTTSWSPDGKTITYTRLLSGATPLGKGGTQICLLNPFTENVTELTKPVEGVWHCRITWSPDGRYIAFIRYKASCGRELWLMDADGTNARLLTKGLESQGADHPIWLQRVGQTE